MDREIRTNVRRATPSAQNAWNKLTKHVQRTLIGALGDSDHDGTANLFDCHPRDPHRQEDFLEEDKKFVENLKTVKKGKLLGRGCVGEVFEVDGNNNLVVKYPRKGARQYSARKLSNETLKDAQNEMQKEAATVKKYNLNKQPLFIPTKILDIDKQGDIALIRPKVKPVTEIYPEMHIVGTITDAQLRQLYRDLLILSEEGFCLVDGLQIGADKAGRILIYDIGFIEKEQKGSDRPYRVNDFQWQELLMLLKKQDKFNSVTRQHYAKLKPVGKQTSTKPSAKPVYNQKQRKPVSSAHRVALKLKRSTSKKVVKMKRSK